MAILSFNVNFPGQSGVFPSEIIIETNDTLATVTTAGYLNHMVADNIPLVNGMMALVSTKTTPNSPLATSSWFNIVSSGGDWSLTSIGVAPGSIITPTIANHIAVYNDTLGTLTEDPSTAISGGSIQAGLSGIAGHFSSFPATATTGQLDLTAVSNSGNFTVTLSNASHGQASVYSVPDAGNAVGRILNAATATPFTNGHLLSASGTGGVVADSGVATTAVQLSANIKAVTTGNIGGAGAGPLTVSQAACTSSSVILCSVKSSSNPCYVITIVPGTGSFTVTTNTDPGASLILDYVLFVAAQ
jgi:hypothetical protein